MPAVCRFSNHLCGRGRPVLLGVHQHAQALVDGDAPARRLRKGQRGRELVGPTPVLLAHACMHPCVTPLLGMQRGVIQPAWYNLALYPVTCNPSPHAE